MNPNELTPTQRVWQILDEYESQELRLDGMRELALELAAELERVKKERDDYFETIKSTCEKIGYTEEVAKAGESSVGTKVSDGISKMFDDLKRQVEELKGWLETETVNRDEFEHLRAENAELRKDTDILNFLESRLRGGAGDGFFFIEDKTLRESALLAMKGDEK